MISVTVIWLGGVAKAITTTGGGATAEMEMSERAESLTTTIMPDPLLGILCFIGGNPEVTTKMTSTSFWRRNPKATSVTGYDNHNDSGRRRNGGATI